MEKERYGNIVEIDLQLFAGDKDSKTEKATPKKREDARKRGQVFTSREMSSAITLLLAFSCIRVLGKQIYGEVASFTEKVLSRYMGDMEYIFNLNNARVLLIDAVMFFLKTAGLVIAVVLFASLAIAYMQVGFVFTTETVKIKLSRLNPAQGFKRIFSMRGFTELVKALVKVIIIVYAAYLGLRGEANNILKLMHIGAGESGAYIINTITSTAVKMCLVLVLFGILDYGYQWWEYERELRMTKHEVKEEYKQIEGNPEVKSRVRQRQRQMSVKRMIHEVPKADVVITNPVHYAVALKYDPKICDAPVVVAKGQNYLALRIKEIAMKNNVEIVENKELARAIYNTVDVGQAIPPELYQAVAEILAYIYSLKGATITG